MRVRFHDAEGDRYQWAEDLRPKTCGKPVGDRDIDQRLISILSAYTRPMLVPSKTSCPETKSPAYTVIGSRILQRVLGTRYCNGDIEAARKIYHTNDIDIWVKTDFERLHLTRYLEKKVKHLSGVTVSTSFQENYQQGIQQSSIRIQRLEGDQLVTVSCIDITAPLEEQQTTEGDSIPMSAENLKAIEKSQERLVRFVSIASLQPMAKILTSHGSSAAFLQAPSDIDYLNSIEEALKNPSCMPETRAKLQDSLLLLTYLEITRRLYHKATVDDFTLHLLKLVYTLIPEKRQALKDALCQVPHYSTGELKKFTDWEAHFTDNPDEPSTMASPATDTAQPTIDIPEAYQEPEPLPQDTYAIKAGKAVTPVAPPKIPREAMKKKEKGQPQRDTQSPKAHTPPRKEAEAFPAPIYFRALDTYQAGLLINELENASSRYEKDDILFRWGLTLDDLERELHTGKISPQMESVYHLAASSTQREILRPMPQPIWGFPLEEPGDPPSRLMFQGSLDTTTTMRSLPGRRTADESPIASTPTPSACYEALKNHIERTPRLPAIPSLPEAELLDCLLGIPGQRPRLPGKEVETLLDILKSIRVGQQTGCEAINYAPVIHIDLNRPGVSKALRSINTKAVNHSVYTYYLRGLLQSTQFPELQSQCASNLSKAASAGATGAALELIHLGLTDPAFPVPVSAAMKMLYNCLKRPTSHQHNLRFQHRLLRQPLSMANSIGLMLDQYLKAPVTKESWCALGQALFNQGRQSSSAIRERTLLVAACAFHLGDDFTKGDEYLKILGKKQLSKFTHTQALDWFIQSLPARIKESAPHLTINSLPLPEHVKANHYTRALQVMIMNDCEGFQAELNTLIAEPDKDWCEWLPHCLPRNLPSLNVGTNWLKPMLALRNYWKHLSSLARAGKGTATTDVQPMDTADETTAVTTPAHQAVITTRHLKACLPSATAQVVKEFRELDTLIVNLMILENPSTPKELQKALEESLPKTEDSVVVPGCRLVARALNSMGVQFSDKSPRELVMPTITPKARKDALVHLKSAICNYGNPYACWLHARLVRANLLTALCTKEGEQQWYEQYLSHLIFAATMGVEGAFRDLLAELIGGRADAITSAIISLLTCHSRRSIQFTLNPGFTPLESHPFLRHITNHSGEKNIRAWGSHLLAALKHLSSELHLCPDYTHKVRLFFIKSHLKIVLSEELAIKVEHDLRIPKGQIQLPLSLQASIVCALNVMPELLAKNAEELIDNSGSPEMRRFVACQNKLQVKAQPISSERKALSIACLQPGDGSHILPWLQWQPGCTGILLLQKIVKTRLPKNAKALNEAVIPAEQLLYLMQQCLVSDCSIKDSTPADPHIEATAGWVALYQQLRPGSSSSVSFTLPSDKAEVMTDEPRSIIRTPLSYTPEEAMADELRSITQLDKMLLSSIKTPEASTSLELGGIIREYTSKISPKGVIKLSGLSELVAVMNFIRRMNSLPREKNIIPYMSVLKAICINASNTGKLHDQQAVFIGILLLEGAIYGIDDAARHYASLALFPESPFSLERMLDVYLHQYQRPRRHKVSFTYDSPRPLPREAKAIHELLDTLFLKPVGARKTTYDLLSKDVIPALEELEQKTHNPHLVSTLNLMISICQDNIKVNKARELFDIASCHTLPKPLLHQWTTHFLSMKTWNPQYKHWVHHTLQPVLKEVFAPSESGHRAIPYIPGLQGLTKEQKEYFLLWHTKENSWWELPVLMGRSELKWWEKTHTRPPFSTCELPGEKADEHYRNTIHESVISAHINRKPLTLQEPQNLTQQSIAAHWKLLFSYEQQLTSSDSVTDQPEGAARGAAAVAKAYLLRGITESDDFNENDQ
ncbi:hypothetical protein [Sansalvadorimonas verongulae]|uniref:hypothetical protein n=1 Tax=Sansalvadorimonas verongulae TaxID=2172824 RepID=UPI0012BCC0D0|nr:hypothetical protein [Sansalvadorimonas verongulae]MTI13961.1 hypothetical protein [Sansalvadorimonas verongulae]